MLEKMTFTTMERFLLLSLLPAEGNITNLKLIRMAKEDLSFDEAELAHLKITEVQTPNGPGTKWEDGLPDKEVNIGKHVSGLIHSKLLKMNKEEALRPEHISLYEKFVEEESE